MIVARTPRGAHRRQAGRETSRDGRRQPGRGLGWGGVTFKIRHVISWRDDKRRDQGRAISTTAKGKRGGRAARG